MKWSLGGFNGRHPAVYNFQEENPEVVEEVANTTMCVGSCSNHGKCIAGKISLIVSNSMLRKQLNC